MTRPLFCFCAAFALGCIASQYFLAPALAENWIGDVRTVNSLRLFAAFLPVSCRAASSDGVFTAANRIGRWPRWRRQSSCAPWS